MLKSIPDTHRKYFIKPLWPTVYKKTVTDKEDHLTHIGLVCVYNKSIRWSNWKREEINTIPKGSEVPILQDYTKETKRVAQGEEEFNFRWSRGNGKLLQDEVDFSLEVNW